MFINRITSGPQYNINSSVKNRYADNKVSFSATPNQPLKKAAEKVAEKTQDVQEAVEKKAESWLEKLFKPTEENADIDTTFAPDGPFSAENLYP